jgi:putative transposase
MDFLSDVLFDGRRLRALTVIDAYTREALAIEVDQGIKGEQVVDAMIRIASTRGAPHTIRVDNWSRVHRESARSVGLPERRDARLQPTGKPTLLDSFNGPTSA